MREQDSEAAFRALFGCHYARMLRMAYYFLQDDDLAQETTLDVLAEIWIRRKTMTLPDAPDVECDAVAPEDDAELFEI